MELFSIRIQRTFQLVSTASKCKHTDFTANIERLYRLVVPYSMYLRVFP